MKKIFAIFIVLGLLVLLACAESENKLFDIEYKVYSSDTLEIVTEKEIYTQDDTVIRYTITNIGNKESCIAGDDNCFSLHEFVDGKWKLVGTKTEHAWNSLGLILPPNQTESREIKLEDYYHLPLDKGKYRICIESLLSNDFEIS